MKKLMPALTMVIAIFAVSCVKDSFDFDKFSDRVSYRPSFVLPLAHGKLTLGNLLEPDDSLVFFDEDNSIRLMIREDSLFTVSVSDILDVSSPDPVWRQFVLSPAPVYPFFSGASVSLEQLVEPGRMSEPQASIIHGSAGSSVAFPEIWPQYLGIFSAYELVDFEFAELVSGEIALDLTNNLPVEISIMINLINQQDWSPVAQILFEHIGPGQTAQATAGLEGVMVRKDMYVEILQFSSPGSGSDEVFINLHDNIDISISSSDLLSNRGHARMPVTIFEGGDDLLSLEFDDGVELDMLTLESGSVKYQVDNNTRGLVINIEAENMKTYEEPWSFELIPNGWGGKLSGIEDFSSLDIELENYDNSIRVNYSMAVGREEGMTEFDLTAGILDFDLLFDDFVIGFASGYFGNQEVSLDDEEFDLDFDLFDKITGDFWLTNPSVRLFYENSAGLPMNLRFNLHGRSSDASKAVSLFGADHPGFDILYPEEPFIVTSGEMVIDRETSEIVDFIALPPSRIDLEALSSLNPAGKTGIPNFITSQSNLTMGMEIELPLEMKLSNLKLTDTIDIDMDPDDIDMIERLLLEIDVTNNFPLGLDLELSLYDSIADLVLHRFEDLMLLDPAGVGADGTVLPGSGKSSSASIQLTPSIVEHMKKATHIIFSARINTGRHNSDQVPVRFLTTDHLEFRLRLQADMNITN